MPGNGRGFRASARVARSAEHTHEATLLLDVNVKQVGQLCRDWRAIVDVIDVRPGAPIKELWDQPTGWAAVPYPPAAVSGSGSATRPASA